ncbi:hypothetical protein ACA910_008967 [Epithemia clementina (nom. ined.)]
MSSMGTLKCAWTGGATGGSTGSHRRWHGALVGMSVGSEPKMSTVGKEKGARTGAWVVGLLVEAWVPWHKMGQLGLALQSEGVAVVVMIVILMIVDCFSTRKVLQVPACPAIAAWSKNLLAKLIIVV